MKTEKKRVAGRTSRAMPRLPLRQPRLHRLRNRREMQHGECRGEDQGRGGSCCGMCPPGRPLRAVNSRAAWPGCGGRRLRGAPILLIQRRTAAMSPGSVTAVSSGPALRLAAPARSTCSVRPRCSGCGMMQRRPSPSLRAWPGLRTGGGEADGVGAGGGAGTRRKPPEAPPAGRHRGCAGPMPSRPDARGEGPPARPGLARPARRRQEFLPGLCPGGRRSPGEWLRRPALSLRREPKLRKLPGIGALLKERQTVTNALGARASSFSPPGLAASFPGLLHPNAVLPKPSRRPRATLPLPPLPPPSSSHLSPPFPTWPGSPHALSK